MFEELLIRATKRVLGLTGLYKLLCIDIDHLNFSIFILSSKPDRHTLPDALPSSFGWDQSKKPM